MMAHKMETYSALLALCEGNTPVVGVFPSQSPDVKCQIYDLLPLDIFLEHHHAN